MKQQTGEEERKEVVERDELENTGKITDILHQPGAVSDLLTLAEKRTGVDRVSLLGGFLALSALCLCVGLGAGLVSGVVGFLYPAYQSVKALHNKDEDMEKRWLTYWVVFSFSHVMEFFLDHLVWWMPLYWFVKTVLLVWCMAPVSQNGSMVIYIFIIKPLYSRHHQDIDSVVGCAVREAGELLELAAEKAKHASVKS